MIDAHYIISDEVLNQFVNFNRSSIEDIIRGKFQQKMFVNYYHTQLCFVFNKNSFFIYIVEPDFLVSKMICRNYDQLIPKEFLKQFLLIKGNLPVRIRQWVTHKYFPLLKNEIIDALIYNKMEFYCNANNRIIAEWKIYGLKFELSDTFTFRYIL